MCQRTAERGRCGAGAELAHDATSAYGDLFISPVTFEGMMSDWNSSRWMSSPTMARHPSKPTSVLGAGLE